MITYLDDVWHKANIHELDTDAVIHARRRYRVKMVAAVGVNYGIDTLCLGLFGLAGTIASHVPLAYGAAGLAHVLLFGLLHWMGVGERSANPHLTHWQAAYAIGVQLLCLALVPNITAYFLAIIFIIFGFATLRLSIWNALSLWLLACFATGGVLLLFRADKLAVIHPTTFEAMVIWLSFSLVLLRAILLGYYATQLRIRLLQDNRHLAQDIAERARSASEWERHRVDLEDMVRERTLSLSIAKEAAEAANRAKTSFLANMSHELRTPMNGIMGFTSLAQGHATDARQREHLTQVARSAQDLLDLIDRILDLAEMEANRLTLNQAEFRLDALLERAGQRAGQRARAKGVGFRVFMEPDLEDPRLVGDDRRLGQVLLELTDNGVKFTERGQVTLSCERLMEDGGWMLLRFQVQDSGIGIAPEQRDGLFEPFRQGDDSRTRRFGGAGLGLAICKRLVNGMGGTLNLDSQPGVGSRFWFTLRLPRPRGPRPD